MNAIAPHEAAAIVHMLRNLRSYTDPNVEKLTLYKAENLTRSLGISIPQNLSYLEVAPGWVRLAIDSLQERIKFEGWRCSNPEQHKFLTDVVRENTLGSETRATILDALIFGVGFLSLGKGVTAEGEPEVLVMNESVFTTTYIQNPRTRKPLWALKISYSDPKKNVVVGELYSRTEVIPFALTVNLDEEDAAASVLPNGNRFTHGIGAVPIVPIMNRRDNLSEHGSHSEITQSMRNILEGAMRIILRIEVQSEIYSAPQRALLNVSGELLQVDGRKNNLVNQMMGQVQIYAAQGDAGSVVPHTWAAHSPEGQVNVLKTWAAQFAAESSLPAERLGVTSQSNPTSAEALKTLLDNLLTRAENRIVDLIGGFNQVGDIIALIAGNGSTPEGWEKAEARFVNPKAPTLAQATDSVLKQISSGVLPSTSRVALEVLGYTPAEIDIIELDRISSGQVSTLEALLAKVPDSAINFSDGFTEEEAAQLGVEVEAVEEGQ